MRLSQCQASCDEQRWGEEQRLERREEVKGRGAERCRGKDQIERRNLDLTSFLSCPATADHRKPTRYQSLLPVPAWQRWAGSGSSLLWLSATCSWHSWGSRGGNLATLWCHSVPGLRRHKTQLREKKRDKIIFHDSGSLYNTPSKL